MDYLHKIRSLSAEGLLKTISYTEKKKKKYIKPRFNFLVHVHISMLFINLNCLHERFIGKGQAIYDFYISVEESYDLSNKTKYTLTYI